MNCVPPTEKQKEAQRQDYKLSWGTTTFTAMNRLWELDKDRPLTMWLVFMNIAPTGRTAQSALLKKLGLDKSNLSRWLTALAGGDPTPNVKGLIVPLIQWKKEGTEKAWSLTDDGKKLLGTIRGDVQNYIDTTTKRQRVSPIDVI